MLVHVVEERLCMYNKFSGCLLLTALLSPLRASTLEFDCYGNCGRPRREQPVFPISTHVRGTTPIWLMLSCDRQLQTLQTRALLAFLATCCFSFVFDRQNDLLVVYQIGKRSSPPLPDEPGGETRNPGLLT
uniref:Secreted protein n=1 Tax=Steinernema glaseri TaxID=37863 RepID=A0A1I7YDV8_9BILA